MAEGPLPRICDAHCHFFSSRFFDVLFEAAAGQRPADNQTLAGGIGWEPPGTPAQLADRWIAELDRHGVARAALIASVPGDESSVAEAVRRHPSRFVGFFMFNPAAPGAPKQLEDALLDETLRTICLFPAMHHYPLHDERVRIVFEAAAGRPGTCVFVHCGVLSVGARQRLGLPSHFDIRLGNPIDLQAVAVRYPTVPVIVPHLGAGFLREALMLADFCPNVHLDTSSSNGWIKYHPGLTLAQAFGQALGVTGPERLLFGTDSSFFPRGWQRSIHDAQRQIWRDLGVSDTDRARIMGGNFDRLFR
jgi:uncharacterized protein